MADVVVVGGNTKNKYIAYLIAAGAAIAIAAIFIYYYTQNQNPGNQAVQTCQNNASQQYQIYLIQFDTFQKQNNNAPLTAQQNAELQTLFQNYQAAEAQCLATATKLQYVDDFYNNILPIAIAGVIVTVGGVTALAIYRRITIGKISRTPTVTINAGENSITAKKVQSGEMTADEGTAQISSSLDRAATYSASDETVIGSEIQQLVIEYESEAATLDAINEVISSEYEISDYVTSETLAYLGL